MDSGNKKQKKSTSEPLVSIGVPVYNGEKFLDECLRSILNQTYKNWECVVVNNCSTDGTAEIVRKYEALDSRFKLVDYKDFVGLVPNWNRLFPNISDQSVYFKVVQADDWIYPEAIELMVDLMEQHPTAGICSSYRIDGKEVNCDGLNIYDGPLFSGKELLERHLKGGIDITGSVTTPLFRISVLKELPTFPDLFNEEEYHVDTRIVYEMMLLADVVFVFKVLSYTRWHEGAETMQLCVRFNTFLNGKEQRLFRFKQFFPELEKAYKTHRHKYAYYLLEQKIKGNKEAVEWHAKYLHRKFSTLDYFKAAIIRNGISYRLMSIFNR